MLLVLAERQDLSR